MSDSTSDITPVPTVSGPTDASSHPIKTPPETIPEEIITTSLPTTLGDVKNLEVTVSEDPYSLRGSKRDDIHINGRKQVAPNLTRRKHKKIKKYYNRQNALIDAYLGSHDEEQLEIEDTLKYGGKVKFAVNASFVCNFFLFIIQLYAAVSTGSLSLFATAADAFMDLVSSCVMLVTSRLAAKANVQKFPVGRKRVETVGIILFCALMTTVSAQLIIDHRNDIAVNVFGLIMSIVGTRFVKTWYLDPTGAICIACLILYSWASTAFEHMWYLVGKSAPQDFLNKLVYVSARAYHAGDKYYVEVDIIMAEEEPLKVTHDVSQTLQRKLEGLSDVERAFVHVDYEDAHDVGTEHKALYEIREPKEPLSKRIKQKFTKN
ncbi:Uncharacterized protein BP5553_00104 [Venustampulla echinocandica]|uniref:Cation efflux protein transmembrane domain-containing protein n=1 Tax=Venustampulla echinocandica TaxID=2656787 RepID=A0A370TX70_9HELO|nr:Uncharacterized protein BP5553_00104 [Venustampulla echinocandica]RDL40125.1 Uncharacterized protein BP5553_00104 [Venustampulla echinocandica]